MVRFNPFTPNANASGFFVGNRNKTLGARAWVALLLLLLVLQLSACASPMGVGELLSQSDLITKLEADPRPTQEPNWLLLDVRSPQEFAEGHIPGAVNIDHRELAERLDELQRFREAEVIVYCERGVRANRAETILDEAGFMRIRHLEGDMSAWRDRELPMETSLTPVTFLPPQDSLGASTSAVDQDALTSWVVNASEGRQLIDKGATLLDARGKGQGKLQLQGALPVRWDQFTPKDPVTRGTLLGDDRVLEQVLRSLGISNQTPVVVFGNPPQGWGEAGRIVWMLRSLGHQQAVFVDGGIESLKAAGVETARQKTVGQLLHSAARQPGDFVVQRTDAWDMTRAQLQAQLESDNPPILIDTREPREYRGKTPYGEQRGGHVPGAINLYFKDLLAADGRLLPESELREQLAAIGITPDKTIVAYCTGGIRSGWLTVVLTDLGYSVKNYAGSMWEWSAGPGDRYPLEKS